MVDAVLITTATASSVSSAYRFALAVSDVRQRFAIYSNTSFHGGIQERISFLNSAELVGGDHSGMVIRTSLFLD
jgi:hypothetical protein